jgi:hypothetical protein
MSGSQPGAEHGAEVTDTSTAAETTAPAETTVAEVVTPAPAGEPAGAIAGTPPAAADATPKTLLEATRLAVSKGAPSTPGDSKDGKTPVVEAKPAVAGAAAATDDKNAPPPFHEHPRWKEVQGQKKALEGNVAALTPRAQSFDAITGFMNTNRLTNDDVKQGFAIMAALKTDPARAWELLQPLVTNVRAFLGHDLPADLQTQVDDGSITAAAASELVRARNQAKFLGERRVEDSRQVAARDENAAAAVVVNSVNDWASAKATSDPDYRQIEPLLHGEVMKTQRAWHTAGKAFNTPALAVALANEAYEKVRKHLQGIRPREAIKPAGSNTASTAATARAAPTSLLEAIRGAVSA